MSVKSALKCVKTRGAKAKGENWARLRPATVRQAESDNFRRAAASPLFAKKRMGLMEFMGLMSDFFAGRIE